MKTAIVLALGLVLVAAMRRQAAATRHWTLAMTLLCAAALPMLGAVAPGWDWPAAAPVATSAAGDAPGPARAEGPVATAIVTATAVRAAPDQTTWYWLTRVRWAGALLGVIGLIVGLLRLAVIVRAATPVADGRLRAHFAAASRTLGVTRPVRLLQSDTRPLLMTWGLFRPTVLLPHSAGDWSDERLRAVLLHELAHIRRGDWPALMLAEIVRAVDWMNPLAWLAARRLRAESELACDDLVLSAGIPGHEYAEHLMAMVRLVGAEHRRAAQAMARPSGIERRVEAMLNRDVNRTPGSAVRRTFVAAALAAASVAIAGYGLSAQSLTSVSGVVFDPMNLGVARATVSLTDTRTEARHEVKTDATGRFEVAGLTPGDYRLEARVPGFTPAVSALAVSGRHVDADVTLRLGTLQETVVTTRGPSAAGVEKTGRMTTAPAAAAPACERQASGGQVRPPMKIRDVHPVYPDSAEPLAGEVVLDVRIGTDGTVASAVPREPADPTLARAAVTAVEQWRFTPTLLNCVPTEVAMTASIRFGVQ